MHQIISAARKSGKTTALVDVAVELHKRGVNDITFCTNTVSQSKRLNTLLKHKLIGEGIGFKQGLYSLTTDDGVYFRFLSSSYFPGLPTNTMLLVDDFEHLPDNGKVKVLSFPNVIMTETPIQD